MSRTAWAWAVVVLATVALAATFLVGPYCNKMTGQVMYVDGGACITGGDLMPIESLHGETDED